MVALGDQPMIKNTTDLDFTVLFFINEIAHGVFVKKLAFFLASRWTSSEDGL